MNFEKVLKFLIEKSEQVIFTLFCTCKQRDYLYLVYLQCVDWLTVSSGSGSFNEVPS